MSDVLDPELALRRQQLLTRSAVLRASLAEQSVVLQTPLAIADSVRAAARWLVRERVWVAGGMAVVLVTRPRRAWRLLRTGWWLWRSARRVQRWLAAAGLTAASSGEPQRS